MVLTVDTVITASYAASRFLMLTIVSNKECTNGTFHSFARSSPYLMIWALG